MLFSAPIDAIIYRRGPQILIGFWLLSALIISNHFSAYLLDFMIRGVSVIKIETLEDLSQRQELKIIVREDASLVEFTDNNSTELARALKKQLFKYFDKVKDGINYALARGLTNGSVAYVNPDRLKMIFTIMELMEKENLVFDGIHISRASAGFEPYFILFNSNVPQWLKLSLNSM